MYIYIHYTEMRNSLNNTSFNLNTVILYCTVCSGEHSSFSPQENGQRQKEHLANQFDRLVAILEERKQELVGLITKQQDEKLKHVRSLIRRHSDNLEAAVMLVESAIQSMEEPHMPLFIQVGSDQLAPAA